MLWKVVNYLSVAHDFWWGLVKSRELKGRDCRGLSDRSAVEEILGTFRHLAGT
jgi:hypothetical protein